MTGISSFFVFSSKIITLVAGLAVYTGNSISGLTLVVGNDDDPLRYDDLTQSISSSRVTFSAVSGRAYQIGVDGYNGRSGDIRLEIQFSQAGQEHVVLMLHGLNSTPEAWDDYVSTRNSVKFRSIEDGVISSLGNLVSDDQGVNYYAVKFGSKDASSGYGELTGDGSETRAVSGSQRGDYSDFLQLGAEVRSAVAAIRNRRGSSVKIVVLAHSRGGLAARAFLQDENEERASVMALATLGTPHRGSALGRIHGYLKSKTPVRRNLDLSWNDPDWQAAEDLASFSGLGGPPLIVTRPTIKFLADNSPQISALNSAIGNLPTGIAYGLLEFGGVHLGRLHSAYEAFDGGFQGLPGGGFTTTARDFVLNGKPITDFIGDGTVPVTSQRSYQIPGFPASAIVLKSDVNGVLHIDERKQVTRIFTLLKSLVGWWGN